MEKEKGEKGQVDGSGTRRRLRKVFLEFYPLLAMALSLRFRRIKRRGARRYAPNYVTALTALVIHIFKVPSLLKSGIVQ